MRLMGMEAVFPKKRTTLPYGDSRVYPYLLNEVTLERPNQIWSTDITYISMSKGFMNLVALMQWYSRYVLDWEISKTLDV